MNALPVITPPISLSLDNGTDDILKNREEDANKQLEAVFISMMIKEMRKAGSEEGLFAGDSSDTFGGLFDSFMSEELANAGGIGLQRLLKDPVTPTINDSSNIHRLAKEAYGNAESNANVTATSGS